MIWFKIVPMLFTGIYLNVSDERTLWILSKIGCSIAYFASSKAKSLTKTQMKWPKRDSLRLSMEQPAQLQYSREHSEWGGGISHRSRGDRRLSSGGFMSNRIPTYRADDYVSVAKVAAGRGHWTVFELHYFAIYANCRVSNMTHMCQLKMRFNNCIC